MKSCLLLKKTSKSSFQPHLKNLSSNIATNPQWFTKKTIFYPHIYWPNKKKEKSSAVSLLTVPAIFYSHFQSPFDNRITWMLCWLWCEREILRQKVFRFIWKVPLFSCRNKCESFLGCGDKVFNVFMLLSVKLPRWRIFKETFEWTWKNLLNHCHVLWCRKKYYHENSVRI